MSIKQRMQKVLDETLDYYDSFDKAGWNANEHSCVYHNPNTGNKCAVGRCLYADQTHLLSHEGSIDDLIRHYGYFSVDRAFKKKYQDLPFDFWSLLQRLHDDWAGDEGRKPSSIPGKSLYEYYTDLKKLNATGKIAIDKYIEDYQEVL